MNFMKYEKLYNINKVKGTWTTYTNGTHHKHIYPTQKAQLTELEEYYKKEHQNYLYTRHKIDSHTCKTIISASTHNIRQIHERSKKVPRSRP